MYVVTDNDGCLGNFTRSFDTEAQAIDFASEVARDSLDTFCHKDADGRRQYPVSVLKDMLHEHTDGYITLQDDDTINAYMMEYYNNDITIEEVE